MSRSWFISLKISHYESQTNLFNSINSFLVLLRQHFSIARVITAILVRHMKTIMVMKMERTVSILWAITTPAVDRHCTRMKTIGNIEIHVAGSHMWLHLTDSKAVKTLLMLLLPVMIGYCIGSPFQYFEKLPPADSSWLVPTLGPKMPVSKLTYAKRSYKILWK